MKLTGWDIIAKSQDFAISAKTARLSRWKWEFLDAIDGAHSIADIAASAGIDTASALVFAEEGIAANLIHVVTLTHDEFQGNAPSLNGTATVAPPAPVAPPVVAVPEPPAPEPLAAVPDLAPSVPEPEPLAAVPAPPKPPAPPAAPTATSTSDLIVNTASSILDRVAALRERALKAREKAANPEAFANVTPPPKVEPVEFSVSSEPKAAPPRSPDEIEFTL